MTKKLTNPKISKNKEKLTNIEETSLKSKLTAEKEIRPSISLRFFDDKFSGFSDLNKSELKSWDKFIKDVNKSDSWDDVFNKYFRGINSDPKSLDKVKRLNIYSDQIEIIHLGLTQKFRIHGANLNGRFKLIWLDPNHKIHKMS
ncbi:MAG6450 family protein [Methanococcus maripaludis]|uniref:Uncharacterized protein n=1 Tax=Methanococcus maripaludis OS7 TaxID=637915 RepID=A0A2Z5PIV6_METMI|nr:hypothetical protein [Methanococcus maripaludis]BAP62923.1 hypothetical protein MMOS7_08370 [Methanococcus maripaludis OS7]